MAFKALSWNIREFGKKRKSETAAQRAARVGARTKRIADFIKSHNADVFGLSEVEGADVRGIMETHFPGFDLHVTDGPNTKELLVGVRNSKFDQKSFTQKRQFNEGNRYLRPGALLSARKGTTWWNMLFLHTDSGIEAGDFGNRFDMFDKVWTLKRALDRKADAACANFVAAGDLNTMGMRYPRNIKAHQRVTNVDEIGGLSTLATRNGMSLLAKDQPLTYRSHGGSLKGDLDHVLSCGVTINSVKVRGWIDETTEAKRKKWITDFSDHCALIFDVA